METVGTEEQSERKLTEAENQLAQRVIFALKYMEIHPPLGVVTNRKEDGTIEVIGSWEKWFMDALDLVDYKVDREAYFARKYAPRKKPGVAHRERSGGVAYCKRRGVRFATPDDWKITLDKCHFCRSAMEREGVE